ncbi:MAG TPA: type III secretion system inner membrane ring subunit SctD [Chlamydiales bacterium]|nr:type III secretion system inner membrane ring subunit SctD [Chlamydiales bacterium]
MHLFIEEGPYRGLVFPLDDGDEWVIGRDPDTCDFLLEDNTVSRQHVVITKDNDSFFIRNLSLTNPTEVNGDFIDHKTELHYGDKIIIGHNTLLFAEDIDEHIPKEELSLKPLSEEEPEENFEDFEKEKSDEDDLSTIFEVEEPLLEEEEENTIFEEEEPLLPFEISHPSSIILKVISGPNSGAEFGMEKDKSYLIGKDPTTADIVFNDLSVSRHHAKITVDENGTIFIEDLGSKNGTLINYFPIEEKTKISSQDIISLGTSTFVVINKEEEQETLYAPQIERIEAKEEIEEKIQEELETIPSWKRQTIPNKFIALASTSLVVLFIIFLSFVSLFKSKPIETARKDHSKEIEAIIKTYDKVHFSYNPGSGKLFLTGHVLTPVEKKEMLFSLKEHNFIESIDDNVIIDELVWESFNSILAEKEAWRGVSIHSPSAGIYSLNGYIQDPKTADDLNDYLVSNFPYIDKLQNNVIVEAVLSAEIASLLQKNDLASVQFSLANGELILTGRYYDKEKQSFDKATSSIKRLKGIKELKNFVVPSKDISGIDLSSKFQVTGVAKKDNRNVSVVINGHILSVGDRFETMQIIAIKPHTVLLEKEGVKYTINYNR